MSKRWWFLSGAAVGLVGAAWLARRQLQRVAAEGSPRYDFQDEWWVEAPIEQVWALISEPEGFPAWWPIYRRAEWLTAERGVGGRFRLNFRVALPYDLTIENEITSAEEPRLVEGRVTGDLVGTWRWTLRPERGGTHVTFQESVGTSKVILNLLAPVAKPAFEWNHRVAAQRGAEGMREFFAGRPTALPKAS